MMGAFGGAVQLTGRSGILESGLKAGQPLKKSWRYISMMPPFPFPHFPRINATAA